MKLKEWAEKTGVKYLTAYRWFKAGTLPVDAYQTESGTIIVQDDSFSSENPMVTSDAQNDAMSVFLKKTVEFSKNNSTVEDFAAFIISNFSLKLNSASDAPKYSRQKPKPEEVQKHFKQFLPDKQKEEQLKTVKNLIKEQNKNLDTVNSVDITLEEPSPFNRIVETVTNDLSEDLEELPSIFSSMAPQNSNVHVYNVSTESLINRRVDLNTTPQQINYTGSTDQAFSDFPSGSVFYLGKEQPTAAAFPLTKRELQSIDTESVKSTQEVPRKRNRRGRPSKER